MGPSVEPAIAAKQSTLQKTLTAALNELGLDAALIAIQASEHGPLIAQMSRGVTPRDTQAIVRALSSKTRRVARWSRTAKAANQKRFVCA